MIAERLTTAQRRQRARRHLRDECAAMGADPLTVELLGTAALFALRSRLLLTRRLVP